MRENFYVKNHVLPKTSSSLITRRNAREMSKDSMSHLELQSKTENLVSNSYHRIKN